MLLVKFLVTWAVRFLFETNVFVLVLKNYFQKGRGA